MFYSRCSAFTLLTLASAVGCAVSDDGDEEVDIARFVGSEPHEERAQQRSRELRLPHESHERSDMVEAVLAGGYGGCYLYKDANYGGTPLFIPQGADFNDLHRINGYGDSVSSIKCDPGATVWSNSNFGGGGYAVSGDIPWLSNSSGPYNDTISSISWPVTGSGHCTFFTDSNYGGASLLVVSGRDYNDLHRTSPSFGDNISSIACSGASPRPTICRNDSWQSGSCFTLAGDFYPNLALIGYGDNVSSLRW